IDETRRGKRRWEHHTKTGRWVRVDPWDTGFVDLAGSQGLLGQREGRTAPPWWTGCKRAQRRVPRGHRLRGDRPGRRLRLSDPHTGAGAQRDAGGRSLPPD
ncbi:MAG TPA: transposase, partial [Mycobacterium sp.]